MDWSEIDRARLECHLLIEQMPEEFMIEASEALQDIYNYQKPLQVISAPSMNVVIPVKVVGRLSAPVSPVTED